MTVFKIHVKILGMYLKYYFKYMYFKILPITAAIISYYMRSATIWASYSRCVFHADLDSC